jgi:mannan endo-1,4-beta-mannosidase
VTTSPHPASRRGSHRRTTWIRRHVGFLACTAIIIGAGGAVAAAKLPLGHPAQPALHGPFLGLYQRDSPMSYAGVNHFARAVGTQPNLVSYYSSWLEPFQSGFARSAAAHGAVPLVQINPAHVSLTAIASGQNDAYLRAYATAVRSYRRPVVVSFGHEMNGAWYSWGYQHTSPATFVAAWRHIVQLFRRQGAKNITWMWTVNVVDMRGNAIPAPAPWWPGRRYVNWVGIDGYYSKASWSFAPLFGPTIKKVHALTHDPILIAETGATPAAGKPAKISDLFAGVHAYGLLGFLWFDADATEDWRIDSPAAIAAFRNGAEGLKMSAS